jgi:hypothetical protein
MKERLFILQTVNGKFICFVQEGDEGLDAYEVEDYYNANKFEDEAEIELFLELINTGKTTSPKIKENWKIFIDPLLLPVSRRSFFAELIDEDVEMDMV